MPFIRRPVTLNHGVVGSNPAGLTNKIKGFHDFPLTFVPKNSIGEHMGNKGSTWETNLHHRFRRSSRISPGVVSAFTNPPIRAGRGLAVRPKLDRMPERYS
jgi:hypothetical protein